MALRFVPHTWWYGFWMVSACDERPLGERADWMAGVWQDDPGGRIFCEYRWRYYAGEDVDAWDMSEETGDRKSFYGFSVSPETVMKDLLDSMHLLAGIQACRQFRVPLPEPYRSILTMDPELLRTDHTERMRELPWVEMFERGPLRNVVDWVPLYGLEGPAAGALVVRHQKTLKEPYMHGRIEYDDGRSYTFEADEADAVMNEGKLPRAERRRRERERQKAAKKARRR